MKCLCEQLGCKYLIIAPLRNINNTSTRTGYCYKMPIPENHITKIDLPYATHFDVFMNGTTDVVKAHLGDITVKFKPFPEVREIFFKKCPNIKMLKQIAAVEKL